MIDRIVKEINTALDNECYIVALTSALTLPDICGSVAYPKMSSTSRYKKWYSEYIGQYEKCPQDPDEPGGEMPYPSADIINDLRNSLLHNGNPNINQKKQNITEFNLIITKDYSFGGIRSKNIYGTERTLEISIRNLCFKLCTVAQHFYQDNKEKFHFDYTIIDFETWQEYPI